MNTPNGARPEQHDVPTTMWAIVIDRFGGPEVLRLGQVPVPEVGASKVLLRVEAAGIGSWDPFECQGGYAEMLGTEPDFPYVLGSDGAGSIVATGQDVDHLDVGDRVFGSAFLSPTGGFYSAFIVLDASLAAPVPSHLEIHEAAGLAGIGITALRGIDDALGVEPGDRLVIVGASGGIGHIAIQLAAARQAQVLAIASGSDGVAFCKSLGAAMAIDGRRDEAARAFERFAPDGIDAALLLTEGEASDSVIEALGPGGRAAFPTGVTITSPTGRSVSSFNGEPDADITRRLVDLVDEFDIKVHIDRIYTPDAIAAAHAALNEHHLGKLVLDTRPLHPD